MREYTGEQRLSPEERAAPRGARLMAFMAAASLALVGCGSPESSIDDRGLPDLSNPDTTASTEATPEENGDIASQTEINLAKNSIYFSTDNDPRTGYSTMCFQSERQREYNESEKSTLITDCWISFCDGPNFVTIDFYDVIFDPRPEKGYVSIGDLEAQAETLPNLLSTGTTTEGSESCQGTTKGKFTSPTHIIANLQEQYACLPSFMTSRPSKMEALKITKSTSTNEEDNDGTYYPLYAVDMSKECFDSRYLD